MNRRIDPKASFDASARRLRQALRNATGKSISAEMRTTFSVNHEIHDTLRLLAARHRCKLNDLLAIAVEDWLAGQGTPPGNISRADIRRRLGRVASPDPAASGPDHGLDPDQL